MAERLPVETIIIRDPVAVAAKLIDMGLSAEGMRAVRSTAMAERANATLHHCANASGTLAYQYGTYALRREFVGEQWKIDRSENVEAIINLEKRLRVIFSNVDVSCNDAHHPKPRSGKGAGTERVCHDNLFGSSLPVYAALEGSGIATYYAMVDERGAIEVSRPIVKGGTFIACRERIYVSDGRDDEPIVTALPLDDDDAVGDFDPKVARK